MTVNLEDLNTHIKKSVIDDLAAIDFIPAIDKANILMVLVGKKTSMHTGFFSEYIATGQELPADHQNNKTAFSKVIAELGLKCKIQIKQLEKEIDNVRSYTEWVVFCVAREISIAVDLFDARERQDAREEGVLLGFPETAVDAFVNDTMIAIEALPLSTKYVTVEEMRFLNHRLSERHWEEEIKYLPDFARTIKQVSAEIYRQCQAEGE